MNLTFDLNMYDMPGLWSKAGAVPLERVSVVAEITQPVAVTTMMQSFINNQSDPIEARYVFPTPFNAVILKVNLKIGEEIVEGIVTAKSDADDVYEEALESGDAAILLRRISDTLYALQVGNLLPNERLEVEITWAEPLRWQKNKLTYRLPNVIAPHYGDPQKAGLALDDVPSHSSCVAYELRFEAVIRGELAEANITSSTHVLTQSKESECTRARLVDDAWLDQALSLELDLPHVPRCVAWTAPDGDGTALLAAVVPDAMPLRPAPRHFTVVIDASGSMEGASMHQARQAVQDILSQLDPQDSVFLLAFGSGTRAITEKAKRVRDLTRREYQEIRDLDATLGGTETMMALKEALKNTPESGDIVLITDGQCYYSDSEVRQLTKKKHRFFTIGVGRETSEDLLQSLAIQTNGACILLSPQEDMTAQIVQHVKRAMSQTLQQRWMWAEMPDRVSSEQTVFAGDLTLTNARFLTPLTGSLTLRLNDHEYSVKPQLAPDWLAPILPRLVANALLPLSDLTELRQQAVHYQLITSETSLVAVKQRHLDSSDVVTPRIVDVPQMAAMQRMSFPDVCLSVHSDHASYDLGVAYMRGQPSSHSAPMARIVSPFYLEVEFAERLSKETSFWDGLEAKLKQGARIGELLVVTVLPESYQAEAAEKIGDEDEALGMRDLLQFSIRHFSLWRRLQLRRLIKALGL